MRLKKQPEEILKKLGIYTPEDIDLDLVAYSLGADVKYIPMSDSEGSIVGTNVKAVININENAEERRQRFSLGHELGHWVNDRGKNLTYRCDASDMRQRYSDKYDFKKQKEVRANKFSAEILIPKYIFHEYYNDLDVSFESVRYLGDEFNVSLTSTSIRLAEVSKRPCMLVCWDKNGRRQWFVRNKIVPESIWPHDMILNPREALKTTESTRETDADKWISHEDSANYTVMESVYSNGYNIFTLLWWKDESQLLNIVEDPRL